VRDVRVWQALLGVEKTVVEDVEFDEVAEVLVGLVRPARGAAGRCGVCQRRCARYDTGEGRRRWRALDLGTVQVVLEADAPRVSCPEHGVVVAHVPWARHGAGHTFAFDDTVAWLATRRPQPPADLDAVDVRQPEIQQRQIELPIACGRQRFSTRGRPPHRMPMRPQAGRQHTPDGGAVLHHQQFGHAPTLAAGTTRTR
jgi:hypothetical protein